MMHFISRLRQNWLGWLTALVLLAGLLVTGLIASGRLDPQPVGQLQADVALSDQSIAAGQQQATWLDESVPAVDFGLKLTAAYQSGEEDIGYGLLVGQPEAYLGVAVSPLGYVTIWQGSETPGDRQTILPWQTWPHVRPGGDSNELWLNIEQNEVTVRLNGEWLWQGSMAMAGRQAGLWTESFGQAAVIDFQRLRLYHE